MATENAKLTKTAQEKELAVIHYLQDLPNRVASIFKHVKLHDESTTFKKVPPWDTFSDKIEHNFKEFGKIPKAPYMDHIFETLKPTLAAYITDVGTAKILLADMFHDFNVDLDVALEHDELKKSVLLEMRFLEDSLKNVADIRQKFHIGRAQDSLEIQVNPGCDDLKLALWLSEQQTAMEAESAMLRMAAGYFDLIDTVRETYDMLQTPGVIGHRKAQIKGLRNNLYRT